MQKRSPLSAGTQQAETAAAILLSRWTASALASSGARWPEEAVGVQEESWRESWMQGDTCASMISTSSQEDRLASAVSQLRGHAGAHLC